ncbi:Phage repressor protein [Pseudomonas syringae pv. tomato]|nr:Phage repressor protein [Pseudomonas syringae pv. tomato]
MTSDTPPTFPEGTPILIRPEGFDLISGKFYVARNTVSGETTFKQFVMDAGVGYLVPLNPSYQPVVLDDGWEIIGRAIDAKITGM